MIEELYLQIEELYLICRPKNYLQIEELSKQSEEVYSIKELYSIEELYLQIEEPFANWRIVWRRKNYSIGRLKNDMQIKELSTDWQNYFQIE